MLVQLKLQFDIITSEDDLSPYQLLICPEDLNMSAALVSALQRHTELGGQVIFSGCSCLLNGQPALHSMGIESAQLIDSEIGYLRGSLSAESEGFVQVVHGQPLALVPSKCGQSLSQLGSPYFERRFPEFCGHSYTPCGPEDHGSAIVLGQGACTTAFPIFKNYGAHGHPNLRHAMAAAIAATGYRDPFSCDGPTHLETSLVKTPTSQVLHLLSFLPMQKTPQRAVVENPFPIQNMSCELKLKACPKRVYMAPTNVDLPFNYERETQTLHFQVSFSEGHTMVVAE